MTSEPSRPQQNDLVEQLRERLEERRRSGLYPAGLESSLDAHARWMVATRVEVPEDRRPRAREALERLEQARIAMQRLELANKVPSPAATSSSVPLGEHVHTTFARLQARQLDPVVGHVHAVAAQVQALAEATVHALASIIDVLDDPQAHQHADLLEQLDALFERLTETGGRSQPHTGSDVDSRLQRLEEAERRRSYDPFYPSTAFEDRFRGPQSGLVELYAPLADELVVQSPVLEIGCGQGSLLDLLAERGVPASGVELDRDLAAGCRARGLDVIAGDGLEVLARAPDGSLGAVVLLQVIEHLSPQRVCELVVLACQKLRPEGWLVMETPNPQSLYVFARAFYIDPTHHTPVHPAYLEFLVREAGFEGARIQWLSPVAEDEALVDDGTENSRRIGAVLFAAQDYRLYAVR